MVDEPDEILPTEPEEAVEPVAQGYSREGRKAAAKAASEYFERKRSHHDARFKDAPLNGYQLADLAMEAKERAETESGAKISITLDVEGNWWFQ